MGKILLRDAVQQAIEEYFIHIDGADCRNIYKLFLTQVEKPLLEVVIKQAAGNQSKAAKWLGMSRNTLKKLIVKYEICGS